MPVDGFSVGRDVTLTIVTPTGPLDLDLITNFTKRPEYVQLKIKGIDGVTRHIRFPDGWMGTMDVERQSSVLDDYFAGLEAGYYAGIPEKPNVITETITEIDGSVSQYRYNKVLLTFDDAGAIAGDQTIKQKIGFVASQRVKVA